MSSVRLEFKESFRKEFRKIPEQYHEKIYRKIKVLKSNPKMGGRLKGALSVFGRLKVGDYRIAYQYKNKALIVTMIKIGARKDFYKKLKRLLP